VSVLLPTTRKLLADVRPCKPLFSNVIAFELFSAEHTRGDLTLLPVMGGGYIVFDRGAALNAGVRTKPAKLEEAHAALERLAGA
jgi:hypothetical protein